MFSFFFLLIYSYLFIHVVIYLMVILFKILIICNNASIISSYNCRGHYAVSEYKTLFFNIKCLLNIITYKCNLKSRKKLGY